MSKKRSKRTSLVSGFRQKTYVLACLLMVMAMAVGSTSADVTYSVGAAPTILNSSLINDNNQTQLGASLSAITGPVTNTVTLVAGGVITSNQDNNAILASLLGNNSALSTDIALVSGSAAGSSLTSLNTQELNTVTAYSRVSSSSVTTDVTNLYASSSVSVSSNSITSENILNKTSQTAEGKLNLTFDSSHPGTATLRTDVLAGNEMAGDAGLYVGSSQFSTSVNDGAATAGFASSASNTTGLTTHVNIAQGAGLSLMVDNNTISTAFTGNNAENVLTVQSGAPGATILNSSSGIANLQVNRTVSSGSSIGGEADVSSSMTESSVYASLQDAAFDTSSLSFDGNSIKSSSTGSVANNQLEVASGLNVVIGAAEMTQANSLDFTDNAETSTTSGGLFVNNMQLSSDSNIYAYGADPAAADAFSVDSRGLIDSALTADGNSFEAIALGNDAYSSIAVLGATSFSSTVSASNSQVLQGTADTRAFVDGATLSVNLGTTGNAVTDEITGSNVSVKNNLMSSLAVGNRDPLLVNIIGTDVTDGISQTAGSSVNNTTGVLSSSAGISAISSQKDPADFNDIFATTDNAAVSLVAGAATSVVTDSTLVQSGNSLSSLANINEGLVAVGVNANRIDASTAAASIQNAGFSWATARTDGSITTTVLTGPSSNLNVLVGDGNLSDATFAGNSISATAGGNLNATALQVTSATDMVVTDVVNVNGLTSNSLSLTSALTGTSSASGEMSVLTDQHAGTFTNGVDPAIEVSAYVNPSQIAGVIQPSSTTLSSSSLVVDGNQMSAAARGNLTTNSLNFSALNIDMTTAELGAPSSATGTNLASMGAVQTLGIRDNALISSVDSMVNANASPEILGRIANTGGVTDVILSVSSNNVSAMAAGNTAINSLSGSGNVLSQDAPAVLDGSLNMGADPSTSAMTIADVAVANAIVQDNSALVRGRVAVDDTFDITAHIDSNGAARTTTDTTLSADNNRVVALATGSSASTTTNLDFNVLQSSAASAVQQNQSGETAASLGGNFGQGVIISATTRDSGFTFLSNQLSSAITASGNTIGGEAVGATATSSLSAGNSDSVMTSGHGNTAVDGAYATIAAPGTTALTGDFMGDVQQVISNRTSSYAYYLDVLAYGDNLSNSTITADRNLMSSHATGADSTSSLTLTANDMSAGGNGENTVDAVLSSDQRAVSGQTTSGAVNANMLNSGGHGVLITAYDLTTAATGTNASETLSASDNTMSTSAYGLNSNNSLTTTVGTSVMGDDSAVRQGTIGLGVSAQGWDRLVATNQQLATGTYDPVNVSKESCASGVCVSAYSVDTLVQINVTGGANGSNVNNDTLVADRNTMTTQAVGAAGSNSITTDADTSITSLSHLIAARQDSSAPVAAISETPTVRIYVDGDGTAGNTAVRDSFITTSDNSYSAEATGLRGANAVAITAGASMVDSGSFPTNAILSAQNLNDTADVLTDLRNSNTHIGVIGAVVGSTMSDDRNIIRSVAKGAENANSMTASSNSLGTVAAEGTGFDIVAYQSSSAAITSNTDDSSTDMTISGAATSVTLTLNNNVYEANATNLLGSNTMSVTASTSNYGDTATAAYTTNTTIGADRMILSTQIVNGTGNVAGETTADYFIRINGGVNGDSISVNDNRIAANARIAENSNSLTNNAGTTLASSALIAGLQTSSVNATALNYQSDTYLNLFAATQGTNIAMTGNEITSAASGLVATNTLSSSANAITSSAPVGSISIAAAPLHTVSAANVVSSEQATSGAISATTESGHFFVDLDVLGAGVSSSVVHQDDNLIQASSTAASGTNALSLTASTSITNVSGVVAASQNISGSSSAVVNDGTVRTITEAVSASVMTIDGNTIQALAAGGYLKNDVTATAGTAISAPAGGVADNVTPPALSFSGVYGIASNQTSSATVDATVNQTPTVSMAIDSNVTANSSLSVSDNVMRAQATNLTADNSASASVSGGLSNVSTGVLNYQNISGTTSANAQGGIVTLSAADLTGTAKVDSNWMLAMATGGTASNDVTVSALTITGTAVGATSSLTTVAAAVTGGSESLATLINNQNRSAAVTATLSDSSLNNAVGNLAVSATFGTVTGTVSVSNNILAAEANGLIADKNAVSMTSDTLITGGGAALGSVQTATAAVTSSINAGTTAITDDARILLSAGAVTGTVTQNRNTVESSSTLNRAINSMDVTSGTAIGSLGSTTTTTAAFGPESATTSTVGFALQNVQSGSAAATVSSSITNMDIETELTSLNGTATVDGNTLLSQSRGQVAQNSMALNAGNALSASASLANVQSNAGNITSTITNGNIGLTAPVVTGVTSVSDNTVQASSGANIAINSMDISGTLVSSNGGSAGALTATADFVALNAQNNSAAVTSSISGYTMHLDSTTSNNGSASVLNNVILADAVGNSSVNTFTIAPKGSFATADFAFNGSQSNTGSVSSSVSNAAIRLNASGATGSFNMSGNSVGATSIGNSTRSTIKAK